QLILPGGYIIERTNGTVDTDDVPRHQMAAMKVLSFLYELAGGVRGSRLAYNTSRFSAETNVEGRFSVALSDSAASVPMPPAPPAEPQVDRPEEGKANQPAYKAADIARRAQAAGESLAEIQDDSKSISGRDLSGQAKEKKALWALEGVSS